MKNTSESLLSFAERELVHKEAIRAAVLNAKPQQRTGIVWTRVLLPIAACLVLAFSVVIAIPEARAEVQRWFHIESPEQYLTEDPENRVPNEQLDSLLVPPVADTQTEPPRTDTPYSEQITYVCDEPIWQSIARDFRIDLGDTMFDGEELYITVTLHGLTALPVIDAVTDGNATQVKVPLEQVAEYFERGHVPEVYTSGQMSFYNDAIGFYYLQFPDGGRLSCGTGPDLWANTEYRDLLNRHHSVYGEDPISDEQREAISRESIAWLNGRELIGVVQESLRYQTVVTYADDPHDHPDRFTYRKVDPIAYMMQFADEDGLVSATLLYRSAVDVGEGEMKTLLEAELGTVRFDLGAVGRLDRKALKAETPSVTFGHQTVRLSYSEWIEVDYDDGIAHAVTNLPTDLYGLTVSVDEPGYIDALGVHDIRIRVTLPEDWTEQQCDAFFSYTHYHCEINGKRYEASTERGERESTHVRTNTLSFTSIPYDRIDRITSMRIFTDLFYTDEMRVGDVRTPMEDNVQYVHPDTSENVNFNGGLMTLSDSVLTLIADGQ